MPTKGEVIVKGISTELPTLNPGDRPASFSITKNGSLVIYIVECASDDSCTTIHKITDGMSIEYRQVRVLGIREGGRKKIKTLSKGESYEFFVTKNGTKETIRITHE